MKRQKLTTALVGIFVSITLPLAVSGAASAAPDKPERIEKTYKKYKPFPAECDPEILATTGTCLILF